MTQISSKLEKITQGLPVWLLPRHKLYDFLRKVRESPLGVSGPAVGVHSLGAPTDLRRVPHSFASFANEWERRCRVSRRTRSLYQPMPSTHKKVIVRKHDRDSISGYVAPADFVIDGKLELLNTSGNVVAIDLRDIKAVYFVRDFSDSDLMLRKTFTTRPRTEGLWVRLKFKDSDVIEGILPNDLTQNPAEGFLVNPPDLRSNTQRVFVPRSALTSVTVLAVIGAVRRRKGTPDTRQVTLFE